MEKKKLRIVFMGTPDFAVSTLKGVIETGHNLVLVVTQPDRPKGRGLKCIPSPVKAEALASRLEVMTPVKIRTEETIKKLKEKRPDLTIVSAYGKILPMSILEIPRLYSLNIHASLLPKYRGAAPINWAIIKGETKTGITVIKMSERMDEGDIFLQKEIPIERSDDAGTLHDKLALLGRKAVIETIARIEKGENYFTPQDGSKASLAPMLKKEDGQVDWGKSPLEIINFVRGVNPWPGAYTYLEGKVVKIHKVESSCTDIPHIQRSTEGSIHVRGDSILVGTGNGCVSVKELQRESRKRMSAAEFAKGFTGLDGKMFSKADR